VGNICIDACEVLSASYLQETSSVGIYLGILYGGECPMICVAVAVGGG